MIITLVMDQYGAQNNGTTVTAMRFAEILRQHGHTVRIVTSVDIDEDNVYKVPCRKIPLVMRIVHSQGMELAKPDKKILRQAIEGSDIVHFFLPFKLSKVGKEIADELGVATISAFHVQPEHITYTIKMNKLEFLHKILYKNFRKFYDKFDHVHCPSLMLKEMLESYNYKAKKHFISNGVLSDFYFKEVTRPAEWEGKFVILMIGRLSREKRQDVIIKAVAKSKHKNDIKVVFCGKGPTRKSLDKCSKKYNVYPEFKFLPREELIDVINSCNLYVHASEVEGEAISCIEAFSCGLVPIISNSVMSATKQFALTEDNLFKKSDVNDLTAKIDYYIDNPEVLKAASEKYIEYGKTFAVEECVKQMEAVYEEIVAENALKTAKVTEKPKEITSTIPKKA